MLMPLNEIGRNLWADETGAIISAEAVMVATLGVAGATVGMETLSKSVNDELTDVAFAIRSFDQSFCVKRRRSAGACVAGSQFQQLPVKTAHEQLLQFQKEAEARQQKQFEPLKKEPRKRESRRKDRDRDEGTDSE